MSNEALNFIKTKAVPYRLRLVAQAVANFTNPRSRTCWASYNALAKEAGCSKATAKRGVRLLEKIGTIRVLNDFRPNRSQTTNIIGIVGFTSETDMTATSIKRGRSKRTPGVFNVGPGGCSTVTSLELKSEIKDEFEEREPPLALSTDFLVNQKDQIVSATVVQLHAHPLPEGWQPSGDDVAYALSRGLSDDEVTEQVESFVSHYRATAKDPLARDWSEKWKNWVRRYDATRRPCRRPVPLAFAEPNDSSSDQLTGYPTPDAWHAALRMYRQGRGWAGEVPFGGPQYGPRPGHPDCIAPRHLLMEHGFASDSVADLADVAGSSAGAAP